MIFSKHLVVIRGGGDLATGVAYRLHRAGFPILVLELAKPLVVRRRVALATAVLEKQVQVEGLRGVLVDTVEAATAVAQTGQIPLLISPHLAQLPLSILVDARMAKRNIDTAVEQAPFVVALGPGFVAGQDCHAVIETKRGHRLGRVIWQGAAMPNTGIPGLVGGKGAERVIRAPVAGTVSWQVGIGDSVAEKALLGSVNGREIRAPFSGVLRGLIASDTAVKAQLKIGDIDARADRAACFTISDKALSIGAGVLEAILTHLNQAQP